MNETDSPRILQASLALSASLLEARSPEAVLRAFMRVGCELLEADGCVFIPFGEFTESLSPQEFGRPPHSSDEDWETLLSQPPFRRQCKACQKREAGQECILLQNEASHQYIHCAPLHRDGREAGMFSFIFPVKIHISEELKAFLPEAAHLVDLSLESLERLAREQMAFDHSAQLPPVGGDVKPLLAEIEYRAVLGERARLAREIHDGLAQTLAFLKIEINRAGNLLSKGETDGAARLLTESTRAVSDAYLEARQAIENLRRVPDGRLETWLHQVAEDFESLTGQRVELGISLDSAFPPNVQVQLIRVVQEALTNVRRHAQAGRVWLSACESDGELVIEVRDNGRGFAPADSIAAARFGLRGMRERAESVGADIQIVSRPNEGTTVRLRVPVTERMMK